MGTRLRKGNCAAHCMWPGTRVMGARTSSVHAIAFARLGEPLLHHAIGIGARPVVRGGRRARSSSRL
eukprot:14473516-Alexandrium_andersonii.AAC.2